MAANQPSSVLCDWRSINRPVYICVYIYAIHTCMLFINTSDWLTALSVTVINPIKLTERLKDLQREGEGKRDTQIEGERETERGRRSERERPGHRGGRGGATGRGARRPVHTPMRLFFLYSVVVPVGVHQDSKTSIWTISSSSRSLHFSFIIWSLFSLIVVNFDSP